MPVEGSVVLGSPVLLPVVLCSRNPSERILELLGLHFGTPPHEFRPGPPAAPPDVLKPVRRYQPAETNQDRIHLLISSGRKTRLPRKTQVLTPRGGNPGLFRARLVLRAAGLIRVRIRARLSLATRLVRTARRTAESAPRSGRVPVFGVSLVFPSAAIHGIWKLDSSPGPGRALARRLLRTSGFTPPLEWQPGDPGTPELREFRDFPAPAAAPAAAPPAAPPPGATRRLLTP